MSKVNYKNIALREIKELSEAFPKYSLGEILYSILREEISGVSQIKDLKNLSDEHIYTGIDKAKEIESE